MMAGRVPFYFIVAQMVKAEEPLPEGEIVFLTIWEFRTALQGG